MRVLGGMVLHYGKEYLEYSLEALTRHCDSTLIVYSDKPTFGAGVNLECPDTSDELYKIAKRFNIEWIENEFNSEAGHRNWLINRARELRYDLLVTADSDEVWPDYLGEVVDQILINKNFTAKRYGVKMITPWQGFDLRCIDGFEPVRIYDLRPDRENEEVSLNKYMYHFGYAISDELMEYKWAIHGHRDELRPNWMKEKWLARATKDVHPVAVGLWNAEPMDKNLLPAMMRRHAHWSYTKP